MKKSERFLIRMTPEELSALDEKVSRTNLSREEFVRRSIQGQTVKEKPPAEYGKILYELRRIGSNLNQLLVIARTHGFVDEREVRKMAKEVEEMDGIFIDAFCKKE
jgi:hypothetical protein